MHALNILGHIIRQHSLLHRPSHVSTVTVMDRFLAVKYGCNCNILAKFIDKHKRTHTSTNTHTCRVWLLETSTHLHQLD